MNRECIINMLDLPLSTGTVAYMIKDLCNVSWTVAIKVENKKSYNKDIKYHITDDLCDWLAEFFDDEGTGKNGTQIYKDLDTNEYYLCITDCNYYDKETDEYKGTDEVHIYFRDYQKW